MTNSSKLTLRPEFLAHRYDPEHDAVHFVQADRALRRQVPFLTDDYLPAAASPVIVRRDEALAAASGTTSRICFIFHSAYCCSTLLANAYDRPGQAASVKEPVFLNDLVGWRLRGGAAGRIQQVLGDGLSLLGRPFEAGETVVIKPSNVVNGLAPAMIAARPDASALLIHAPLEIYLGSIAGKGLKGRLWVRELLSKQMKEGLVDLGFSAEEIFGQSDLQVAALGWLAQHQLFAKIAKVWPDRTRTISSETLVARPLESLVALDRLFDVCTAPDKLATIVDDVFRRHAKSGEAFDSKDRRADQENALRTHAEEIALVGKWAEIIAERAGIALELPNPLIIG